MPKLELIISCVWSWFMRKTMLQKLFSRKKDRKDENEEEEMFVERIRLESMKMSVGNLLSKLTIQEPTFDRMIVVNRRAGMKNNKPDRGIHVKHFKIFHG